MKAAAIAVLLLPLSFAFAQPPDTLWTRAVWAPSGPVEARAVCLTQDGGYAVVGICCGWYFHTFYYSSFVAKLNRTGQTEWQWQVQGVASLTSSYFNDIIATADGKIVAVGSGCWFGGHGNDDFLFAVCLNAQGDTVWTFHSPEDDTLWRGGGHSVVAVPDGYLIAGTNRRSFCKIDTSGNLLWQRNWGMSLEDIAPLADGNYICVGHSGSGGPQCLMVKVTPDGDTLWTRDCNTSFDEIANGVTATADGGFAICGSFQVLSYPRDMFMALKTSDGDHLDTRGYECYPCEARDIRQTYDGGFVLAGSVTFNGQSGDSTCIGILKTGPNLDQRWMKTWGGTGSDGANAVVQDRDSCYVVAGHWGGESWYVAKLAAHPVGIDERDLEALPGELRLHCAPNPFNAATTLSFSLPRQARARLAVYDVMGREMRVLADENFAAGEHRMFFDGSGLPSGIYFARLQCEEFAATQKLLLLK